MMMIRRGIRAAFMLIPLFGLQMILTVHRPRSSNQTAEQLHEFVFMLTVGSQVWRLQTKFSFSLVLPPPTSGFVQKSDYGFPDFSGTKLLLFPDFSRHFVNKTLQNWLFKRWNLLDNVFIYSNYRIGLKFWKKINSNKFIGNQQCNSHLLFPGQHYSFKDISTLFHTYDHFQGVSKPWKFLHYIPGLSILFQDLYEPCTWLCFCRCLFVRSLVGWFVSQKDLRNYL